MNGRQWIVVVIIALAAGAIGGIISGVFAGGVNIYINDSSRSNEPVALPEPPQPPASTQSNEVR